MKYDTIIVGGGPAAITAGLYLHRYGRKTLLITEFFGGQTLLAGEVDNFPSYKKTNGVELIQKMKEQISSLKNLDIVEGKKAKLTANVSGNFSIRAGEEEYLAKTVLMAGGRRPRKLGLKNEEELLGRGLSYCATCDGPLSANKEVVVIGGGYSATESALILKKIASKVTMINLNKELQGEKITVDQVNSDKEINVINNAKTTALNIKDGRLDSVEYESSDSKNIITCQMVFVEIGQIPNTEGFEALDKNNFGEIVINPKNNMTSVDGIFASGDISDIEYKQIIIACGEGAKGAIAINKYLQAKE